MRILLASPVYPQSASGPRSYLEDLCHHLRGKHDITIAAYTTSFLEAFPGTRIATVARRRPLLVRLIRYFWVLLRESQNIDVIYAQNAMAAGLPAALVSSLRNIPLVIRLVSDEARERSILERLSDENSRIRFMRLVQGWVLRQALVILVSSKYLGRQMVKTYGLDPRKIIINYEPLEKEIKLPFAFKKVPGQIVRGSELLDKSLAEAWYIVNNSEIYIHDIEGHYHLLLYALRVNLSVRVEKGSIATEIIEKGLENFSWETHLKKIGQALTLALQPIK